MPWTETPQFERGSTFMNGTAFDPDDPIPAVNLEGKEYVFPDKVYGTGVPVKVRCVRNTTGGLVYPSRAYTYDPAYLRQRVNAISTIAGGSVVIADELLPVGGVVNLDLFYVVLSGPCLVYTPSSVGGVINQGDQLVAMVAATAGNVDAGAVVGGNLFASTAESLGKIGRAMSAATTANTGTLVLAMLESKW